MKETSLFRPFASRGSSTRAGRLAGGAAALVLIAACAGATVGPEQPPPSRPGLTVQARTPQPGQARLVPKSLALHDALRIAVGANPGLAALSEEIAAAAGRVRQAGLWPNPTLEAGTEEGRSNRALGFGGDNKIAAAIWQPLPLSGRIGAARALAERELEVICLIHEQQTRSLVSAVHGAFHGALAKETALEIAAASRGIARDLYEAAEARVREGAAPETERIRAEIELAEAEVAHAEAEGALRIARQDLFTLMGLDDRGASTLVGDLEREFPPVAPEELRAAVLEGHPTLLAARRAVDRARAELLLARRRWLADPQIGIGAGRLREDGEVHAILEWGVSIDLPLFDRNQGAVEERRALLRQSGHILMATRGEILNRLNRASATYDRLRTQASSYRERIIPGAESAIDLIREGFRQGKLSQLDVLDAQRTLAGSRSTYVDLLEGLHRVAAEIEELGGRRISEFQPR